jgi:hypothetical protein
MFDPSLYTRAPVFSVQEGVALVGALLAAQPKGMPASVAKAADKLRQRLQAAQGALVARHREVNLQTEEDTRALDSEMDGAWGGLRQRLEGYASLSRSQHEKARRSAELLTTLFGTGGLTFLSATYATQFTAMETLLARIHKEKLEAEIDELCGPEFLSHIKALMPRYQAMVHGVFSRERAAGENLLDHRHALARAIVAYATAVCATVDEDDPKTVERAVVALRPLENQRFQSNSRRSPAPEPPPAPSLTATALT